MQDIARLQDQPVYAACASFFVGDQAETRAAFTAMHPIGRIGTPREVADAVIWLCSERSSFVTGHGLLVDGGFTAQ